MTNAIDTVIAQLNEVFAPMDARVLENSLAWARGRAEAIKAAKVEYASLRGNAWAYYEKMHAVAGGKTWYNVFTTSNAPQLDEFITKNCAATAEKRNATIAAKLTRAGVTEVIASSFEHTSDGFNGFFTVETNKGRKTVKVETVYAGGYNVQRLHLRVLVHVA